MHSFSKQSLLLAAVAVISVGSYISLEHNKIDSTSDKQSESKNTSDVVASAINSDNTCVSVHDVDYMDTLSEDSDVLFSGCGGLL